MSGESGAGAGWSQASMARELLDDARVVLRQVVNEAVDAGSPYLPCRHCLTSRADRDDTEHAEWCVIRQVQTLLTRMAEAGY